MLKDLETPGWPNQVGPPFSPQGEVVRLGLLWERGGCATEQMEKHGNERVEKLDV